MEINHVYKKLALKYHPDKDLSKHKRNTELFKKIANAKELLLDKHRRAAYDRQFNTPPTF